MNCDLRRLLSFLSGFAVASTTSTFQMSSISAQFDRAVEIVQSLPGTDPIQTDYEERLAMYRYYNRRPFPSF